MPILRPNVCICMRPTAKCDRVKPLRMLRPTRRVASCTLTSNYHLLRLPSYLLASLFHNSKLRAPIGE